MVVAIVITDSHDGDTGPDRRNSKTSGVNARTCRRAGDKAATKYYHRKKGTITQGIIS